jgi:hypothetical protein
MASRSSWSTAGWAPFPEIAIEDVRGAGRRLCICKRQLRSIVEGGERKIVSLPSARSATHWRYGMTTSVCASVVDACHAALVAALVIQRLLEPGPRGSDADLKARWAFI